MPSKLAKREQEKSAAPQASPLPPSTGMDVPAVSRGLFAAAASILVILMFPPHCHRRGRQHNSLWRRQSPALYLRPAFNQAFSLNAALCSIRRSGSGKAQRIGVR